MTAKKTGTDEITFEFELNEAQTAKMHELGMSEADISQCLGKLLDFMYTYKQSVLTKLRMKAGKPDKEIEEALLNIVGSVTQDPAKIHEIAALLLGAFFRLNEEMAEYRKR